MDRNCGKESKVDKEYDAISKGSLVLAVDQAKKIEVESARDIIKLIEEKVKFNLHNNVDGLRDDHFAHLEKRIRAIISAKERERVVEEIRNFVPYNVPVNRDKLADKISGGGK